MITLKAVMETGAFLFHCIGPTHEIQMSLKFHPLVEQG